MVGQSTTTPTPAPTPTPDPYNHILGGRDDDDTKTGTGNKDRISGGYGDDEIHGNAADDLLYGGRDDDEIFGGPGNDQIYGDGEGDEQGGDDILWGGPGHDFLDGGSGADQINGGPSGGTESAPANARYDCMSVIKNICDTVLNYYKHISDWAYPGDTVSYHWSSAGVNVDLEVSSINPGTGAGTGGYAQGDVLTGIENIVGSRFNDVLEGSTGPNLLRGGAGADTLRGGDSHDYNAVDYRDSPCGVDVSLLTRIGANGPDCGARKSSYARGDRLRDISIIHGSHHSDVLGANTYPNRLFGHLGNDTLVSNVGGSQSKPQMLDGGEGSDTVSYSIIGAQSPVTVKLNSGTAEFGADLDGFSHDSLRNIENVIGTSGNDNIAGSANANNTLRGGPGNDTLTSVGNPNDPLRAKWVEVPCGPGLSGKCLKLEGNARRTNYLYGDAGNDHLNAGGHFDHFDGGAGTDTVSYIHATAGVDVNLLTGRSSDASGHAERDTYANIEKVFGSNHDDTITGDARNNVFTGAGGHDEFRFQGRFGNDTITDYNLVSREVIAVCMGTVSNLATWTGADSGSNHVITVRFNNATAGTITLEGITSPSNLNVEIRVIASDGTCTEIPAPAVTAVAITSNAGSDNTYVLGDVISVSVTFDQKVDVDVNGGTPQIIIKMDPSFGEKEANYASGSGTRTLIFNYTVVTNNVSTQGIAVLGNRLQLSGGTIQSETGQRNADLSHTGLPHDPSHKVQHDG